ncbi:MAG: hypothetical protein QM820_60865 [Minicystis sp.]
MVTSDCNIGGIKTACNQEGLAAVSAGKALGNGSTVALVAGGALLATGAALFFTEPRRPADPRKAAAITWSADILSIDGRGAVAGVRGGF